MKKRVKDSPIILESSQTVENDAKVEAVWRTYLTTGTHSTERRNRNFFKLLPGHPRCNGCYAPLDGTGSIIVRMFYGKRASNLNPNYCNACEVFARKHQGGAEIELSLLFADVRGSTTLAESMNPTEYSRLINKFYKTAVRILVKKDALIDKIIGDQAIGLFVPGFAGERHSLRAIEAARDIMLAAGYSQTQDPWIPLGIGVHTGIAFVGALGDENGTIDITVLGDAANTAARLSTNANSGEILVSESAARESRISIETLKMRELDLKGKSQKVKAWVMEV